jgi:hypothetical protein
VQPQPSGVGVSSRGRIPAPFAPGEDELGEGAEAGETREREREEHRDLR